MRLLLTVLIAMLIASTAGAEKAPSFGPRDKRIRYILYDPDQVFRIDASYGTSTMIVFADNEKIETIGAGDALAWKIEPNKKGNILFVKPVDKKANANLNVITNRHQYVFMLTADFRPVSRQIFKVVFRYPDETGADAALLDEARERAANPNLANLDVANTNSNYGYKGSALAKPLVVFDDGMKTFFRFQGEIPAIFIVDRNRNESLVNLRREGDYMVVDKVNYQWTIRNGNEQACLFNLRLNNVDEPTGLDPFAPTTVGPPLPRVKVPHAISK